jgi:hypothetical protein
MTCTYGYFFHFIKKIVKRVGTKVARILKNFKESRGWKRNVEFELDRSFTSVGAMCAYGVVVKITFNVVSQQVCMLLLTCA